MRPDPFTFIQTQTFVTHPAIVPEMTLHLATEVTPLWKLTEERLKTDNLPPPFWAFAWPGGQGIARYVLDNPSSVAGKRVLDFAAGSGIGAIAAMKAGAAYAVATEIDPLAHEAIKLNAALNQVEVALEGAVDMTRPPPRIDVILVGDACYEQSMSALLMRWLWLSVAAGIQVFLADPGRAYVPHDGLTKRATYTVPTSRDLEDQDQRVVTVWDVGLPPED